ncbi:MAG: serine/threonine-protein kinase, partial [Verrucomicrobiota bacterium]
MSSSEEEKLFQQALELNGSARDAFLREACGDRSDLREAVEDLIRAFEESETVDLIGGVSGGEVETGVAIGLFVDRYRLEAVLGEGGMGTVYRAYQSEPVKRAVALKVIKLGMDTRQVKARFEAERQALAMMSHPGIAAVLDAGQTASGRPYFVMDLVEGQAITDYCDDHRLTIEERLDLFLSVSDAVQHAHQKGIIHRDLKPSNILVRDE